MSWGLILTGAQHTHLGAKSSQEFPSSHWRCIFFFQKIETGLYFSLPHMRAHTHTYVKYITSATMSLQLSPSESSLFFMLSLRATEYQMRFEDKNCTLKLLPVILYLCYSGFNFIHLFCNLINLGLGADLSC